MTRRGHRLHAGDLAPWPERCRWASGHLLLAALIFAPWCWGCTWPAGGNELNLLLLAATLAWLPGVVRERPPRLLLLAVAAVLLQGWLLTLNSRALFAEETGYFAPLEQPAPWLPGSVERDLSWQEMARVTALLGAVLAACSLGRRRAWRRRFALAMVAAAVSIVLLGCAQRWTGASDIFWGPRRLDYFFGTYRNVTSAGEYLNLALPLAAAAAWIAPERSPGRRAAAVCALAILAAGVLVCGSKAAPLVALACGLAFLLAQRRELTRRFSAGRAAGLLVLMLAVALMTWGAGWSVSQDRWTRLFAAGGEVTLGNRLEVDRACFAAAGSVAWTGAGPGTFPVFFPALQAVSANVPEGRWLAAHNDYLQTFLEWGAPGALAWSVYFFGALGRLIAGWRRGGWCREDRAWGLGFALALAGTTVMAAVDFPLQVASLRLDVAVLAGVAWSSSRWPRARVFREPRIVLRDEGRFLPSAFTRCVDRRCCEYDLSGSVDPSTGTNSKP